MERSNVVFTLHKKRAPFIYFFASLVFNFFKIISFFNVKGSALAQWGQILAGG
jgi:hypothetical protein